MPRERNSLVLTPIFEHEQQKLISEFTIAKTAPRPVSHVRRAPSPARIGRPSLVRCRSSASQKVPSDPAGSRMGLESDDYRSAGPRARALLERLTNDVVSAAAFEFIDGCARSMSRTYGDHRTGWLAPAVSAADLGRARIPAAALPRDPSTPAAILGTSTSDSRPALLAPRDLGSDVAARAATDLRRVRSGPGTVRRFEPPVFHWPRCGASGAGEQRRTAQAELRR